MKSVVAPKSGADPRLLLLLTAALFSTGGVAIKSVHLAGAQVACLRSAIAAATLFLFLPGARRHWNTRVLLLSLAYAATLVAFVLANKLTTSASAIFLQDTAPLYILVLSSFFLHERPTRADLFFMLPLAAGLCLFFAGSEGALQTAPNPRLGNWIAAASGVSYAILVVGFRWFARIGDQNSGVATVGLGNVMAAAICLPFAWPLHSGHAVDWLILVYLGAVQIGLAYFLMTRAIKHIPAIEASLLLLLEPVLNPIWTWLVYRERPGSLALAGGALIIGATAAKTAWGALQTRARAAQP
jgi:drug/metabolite transporter (DMT)-like permease